MGSPKRSAVPVRTPRCVHTAYEPQLPHDGYNLCHSRCVYVLPAETERCMHSWKRWVFVVLGQEPDSCDEEWKLCCEVARPPWSNWALNARICVQHQCFLWLRNILVTNWCSECLAWKKFRAPCLLVSSTCGVLSPPVPLPTLTRIHTRTRTCTHARRRAHLHRYTCARWAVWCFQCDSLCGVSCTHFHANCRGRTSLLCFLDWGTQGLLAGGGI